MSSGAIDMGVGQTRSRNAKDFLSSLLIAWAYARNEEEARASYVDLSDEARYTHKLLQLTKPSGGCYRPSEINATRDVNDLLSGSPNKDIDDASTALPLSASCSNILLVPAGLWQ